MLATAHARIDVLSKKISLEVGIEQITSNINERESRAVISPACVINNFLETNEFDEPTDLEEFLLGDNDLGIFLKDNDLLPNLENHDTMFLLPSRFQQLGDNFRDRLDLIFLTYKHIDVRYHFIKEKVEKGIVELFFVGTEYQLADLFTKALPVERFHYLVRRLGMRCLTPAELEALENESA
nr:retrovirus-related Pol polyprotein from transposon TNT 1-94 [Tanacetum cinerariifolium]